MTVRTTRDLKRNVCATTITLMYELEARVCQQQVELELGSSIEMTMILIIRRRGQGKDKRHKTRDKRQKTTAVCNKTDVSCLRFRKEPWIEFPRSTGGG